MNRKMLMTVLVALIAVTAFSGVSYAAISMTYNSDNTAEVEYTVLSQDNFTFNEDGRLRYYSLVSSETDGKVMYYLLNSGYDDQDQEIPLVKMAKKLDGTYYKHNNKYYWGALIGSSSMTINMVNSDDENPVISIPMGGFVKNNGDWRYFLKVYHLDENDQEDYVEWLWSKGNGWNNFALDTDNNIRNRIIERIGQSTYDAMSSAQKTQLLADEKQKIRVPRGDAPEYTVHIELYFGGPEQTITSIGRTVGGNNPVAGSTGLRPAESNYIMMDDAWVRYVYDSEVTYIYYKP